MGYELLSKEYINNKKPLLIKCNKDHIFRITYNDFISGHRCPKCSFINKKSKPETEIIEYIKKIYLGKIIENDRSLIKNPVTGKMLELDIYLPDLKKAIEFNGIYWHSKENVKLRDIEKIKQCKEKSINLLVIKEEIWINDKEKCLKNIQYLISTVYNIP